MLPIQLVSFLFLIIYPTASLLGSARIGPEMKT